MTVGKIISNNFYREIIERYCQQQVYTLRQSLRTRAMQDKFISLLFYHVYYNLIWKHFFILIRQENEIFQLTFHLNIVFTKEKTLARCTIWIRIIVTKLEFYFKQTDLIDSSHSFVKLPSLRQDCKSWIPNEEIYIMCVSSRFFETGHSLWSVTHYACNQVLDTGAKFSYLIICYVSWDHNLNSLFK